MKLKFLSYALLFALSLLLPTMSLVAAETPIETKTVTYQVGNETFEGSVPVRWKIDGKAPASSSRTTGWATVRSRRPAPSSSPKKATSRSPSTCTARASTPAARRGQETLRRVLQGFLQVPRPLEGRLRRTPQAAHVDPTRIGAIGFCFGGATVLELARSGANVAGVVTFHGTLATKTPAKPGDIKAKESSFSTARKTR